MRRRDGQRREGRASKDECPPREEEPEKVPDTLYGKVETNVKVVLEGEARLRKPRAWPEPGSEDRSTE